MTPALFKRLVALGFEPGSENATGWAVAELERLKAENAQLERDVCLPRPLTQNIEQPAPGNCWTCVHRYGTDHPDGQGFCRLRHRESPFDATAQAVQDWVWGVHLDRYLMPPKSAQPCPGYRPHPPDDLPMTPTATDPAEGRTPSSTKEDS